MTPYKLIKTEATSNGTRFIFEGATYQDVAGTELKTAAVTEAGKLGIASPAIVSAEPPYPVNEAGESNEGLHRGEERIAAYRRDIVITKSII